MNVSTALSGWGSTFIDVAVNRVAKLIEELVTAPQRVREKAAKLLLEAKLIKKTLVRISFLLSDEIDGSSEIDIRSLVYQCQLETDLVMAQVKMKKINLEDADNWDESWIERLTHTIVSVREELYMILSCPPMPTPHKGMPVSSWSSNCISSQVSTFFGREYEIRKLVNDIENSPRNLITIISMVGITGIGKTSLAKAIFYHDFYQICFARKIWISMDINSDFTSILQAIVESVEGNVCIVRNAEMLRLKIHQLFLTLLPVLIVLDGVTHECSVDWDVFHAILPKKCCILVTTQSQAVAFSMGSTIVHRLQPLPDPHCTSILIDVAFSLSLPVEQRFNDLVRNIVQKCRGIPLLVKTIGYRLKSMGCMDLINWQHVAHEDLLELFKEGNGELMRCLRIFYNAFPSHLKGYLSYFAFFPLDHVFEDYELVKMWMGEGLIKEQRINDQENVAFSHFKEFLERSYFEEKMTREGKRYKVNIVVHILALYLSAGDGLRLPKDDESHFEDVRAISVPSSSIHSVQGFISVSSILVWKKEAMRPPIESNLFDKLRFVRVLCLKDCNISALPISICKLVLLRYLNISNNPLTNLPRETCDLHMLQSLNLLSCPIRSLPVDMGRMPSVFHLLIDMPLERDSEIQQMKRLRQLVLCITLPRQIEHLKDISDIRDLCISMLETIPSEDDAKMAKLKDKKKLRRLALAWTQGRIEPSSDMEVLTGLETNIRLTELKIEYYLGLEFPQWMLNLSALVDLDLEGIRAGVLGVLSTFQGLKRLRLSSIEELETLDRNTLDTLGGGFPKLESLCLHHMSNLRRWIGVLDNDFPVLESIVMEDFKVFDTLLGLPHFMALSYIELRNCPGLVIFPVEMPSSLQHVIIKNCPELIRHCILPGVKKRFESMGILLSTEGLPPEGMQ